MHPVTPVPAHEARRVFVIGIGTTKFEKPGRRKDWDYPDMIGEATNKALNDAKLKYTDIEQAAVGYLYGASCCGQKGLYELGMTGIPVYNVNNACASGSSAMNMMKQFIQTGMTHCALAVGFEKMAPGSLDTMGTLPDRAQPVENHVNVMAETYGIEPAPMTAQMFGMAGKEHMEKYGTKREIFAKIAYKNHKHSVHNPDAQFQVEYSMDQILNARKIYDFMGLLECSPTSDGASAVILCSEHFLRQRPHLKFQAVEILGAVLGTDLPSAFNSKSCINMVGFELIQNISRKLYKETGLGPQDVQVIECHDCFAPNELLAYESLGLCPVGKGAEIVERGDNTYGGRWVVNPSGGLEAKGHPIGATGVSQCVELCKHLRGIAGKRQVPGARVALQHNIGIGGAGFVAMYRLAFPLYPGERPALASLGNDTQFNSDVIFREIAERGKKQPDLVKRVAASFRLTIKTPNGERVWFIDAKQPTLVVNNDTNTKADCEVSTSEEVLIQMAKAEITPDAAFLKGQVKLKGDMSKAMKLRELLGKEKLNAKL